MVKGGIATNDVFNFVHKQSVLRKSTNKIDHKLLRTTMRQKLNDACAHASRLRQIRGRMRQGLIANTGNKHKVTQVLSKMKEDARYHKKKCKKKNDKKYETCRRKQEEKVLFDGIPEETRTLIQGVNVFRRNVKPEPPLPPMVCSKDINLTDNEMAFLCKGPRFMMRPKLDLVEFETELEKMVVKRKFREKEEEEEEVGNGERAPKLTTTKEEDKITKRQEEKLEAQARMVYNKESKCLDMGNLRASDYKFNRNIHLPRSEDVQKESKHNIRREEMLRVFDQVVAEEKERENKKKGRKSKKNEKKEIGEGDNLTREEWLGLKSLRKKVKEGIIVITETDKSKRFCILTPEQYINSGEEHTKKDKKVNRDQIKKVQKTVNDHCGWLGEIFGCGDNWDHRDRIINSMNDCSDAVAPLYLLVKDHKGWKEESGDPPPSRPVCSGNQGMNKHLSEIVSMVLEPLAHVSKGEDIDSTGELLEKIEKLNVRRKNGELQQLKKEKGSNTHIGEEVEDTSAKEEKESEKSENEIFMKEFKMKRVERLRDLKVRGSVLPNVKAKLWATRLLDEVNGRDVGIKVEKKKKKRKNNEKEEDVPPLQKMREESYSIVGTDVKALFPSLKDVECARIARQAVMNCD